MHAFTTFTWAVLAGVTLAIKLTNPDFAVTAGVPFTITWAEAQGPVTIVLVNGPSTDLQVVETLTSGASGNSYTWTPTKDLSRGPYALKISTDGAPSQVNYSLQFPIAGADPSGAATSAAQPVTTSTPATGAIATKNAMKTTVAPPGQSQSMSSPPTRASNSASYSASSSTSCSASHSASSSSMPGSKTVMTSEATGLGVSMTLLLVVGASFALF